MAERRITLRPHGMHWLGDAPFAGDLCSHGRVELRIGDDVLLDPKTADEYTLSAAALRLLRSLDIGHRGDGQGDGQLFPCCGFVLYAVDDSPDVLMFGCPTGVEFEIERDERAGECFIRDHRGRAWRVDGDAWTAAVRDFVDLVAAFHAECAAKEPSDEDAEGYGRFRDEWYRRRGKRFVAPAVRR